MHIGCGWHIKTTSNSSLPFGSLPQDIQRKVAFVYCHQYLVIQVFGCLHSKFIYYKLADSYSDHLKCLNSEEGLRVSQRGDKSIGKKSLKVYGFCANLPQFLRLNQYLLNLMLKGKAGFILKLQAILANPEHGKVVAWSKSGSSFLIYDLTAFEDILTAYFRHKRFSSFVRQLNMYGFHKCRGEKMGLEFKHPLFTRQKPEDHLLIDRKKSVEVSFQLPTISKILEINSMRDFDPMNESPELAPSEVEEELIPSTRTKFRLNSSQMTIKLNERLTSLCSLQENDDHSLGYLKTESMPLCPEESLQKEGSEKTSQMETLLFQ